MLISLKDKKALVGGASQGLGKAIALQLAASGATVTLMARNEEKLQAVVQELPVAHGQQHGHLVVDFNNFEEYQLLISDYFSRQGVDILVNNTQGPPAGTVLEKGAEDYLAAFRLLFQTVQFTTSLAVPQMRKNNFGRVINLTSRTVKEPADNLALSNTIRAAVVTWAKTLSREVAKHNITVNSILTGNFDTERLRQLFDLQAKAKGLTLEQVTEQARADIPMRRLGQPTEMAQLVTFLASEQASYITGTAIAIDGGLIKSL